MKVNEIEKAFLNKGWIRGGILLFRPEVAKEFVRAARDKSIPIAGIDGFHLLKNNKIQPDQKLSTDLGLFDGDTWDRTLSDLSGPFDENVWFEVVLDAIRNIEIDYPK